MEPRLVRFPDGTTAMVEPHCEVCAKGFATMTAASTGPDPTAETSSTQGPALKRVYQPGEIKQLFGDGPLQQQAVNSDVTLVTLKDGRVVAITGIEYLQRCNGNTKSLEEVAREIAYDEENGRHL